VEREEERSKDGRGSEEIKYGGAQEIKTMYTYEKRTRKVP
jgi:hypothetical protein